MPQNLETTLIVLADEPVQVPVASALQAAARGLAYSEGCYIAQLADIPDLRHFVFEADPWCVIAIDEASIEALRAAFDLTSDAFSPDVPAERYGYTFVAAPGFADCLDDPDAKRTVWKRMQVAVHPGNPLD